MNDQGLPEVRDGLAHVIVVGRYITNGPWEATDSRTGEFGRGATAAEAVANLGNTIEVGEQRGVRAMSATACSLVGLTWEEIISVDCCPGVSVRRRLAWWMMYRLLPDEYVVPSGPEIAAAYSKASHANVYAACEKADQVLSPEVKDQFRRAWHSALRCRAKPKRVDDQWWFHEAMRAMSPGTAVFGLPT